MDKKCTLIAAALMVAGVFSANAQSSTTVPEAQWKAGNYYLLFKDRFFRFVFKW